MPRPQEMHSLAYRLRVTREARGLTQGELADAANMRQPDISKIERGLILQTTGIARLAAALNVSARWLELGEGSPEDGSPLDRNWANRVRELAPGSQGRGVAHDLSYPQPIMVPRTIDWEDLMTGALPETFSLVVKDDSMAPLLTRGNVARFATKKTPEPGKRVLVADRDGHAYIREYRVRRAEHWQAVALNEAYEPLDSVADGLSVLAVLTGVDWE